MVHVEGAGLAVEVRLVGQDDTLGVGLGVLAVPEVGVHRHVAGLLLQTEAHLIVQGRELGGGQVSVGVKGQSFRNTHYIRIYFLLCLATRRVWSERIHEYD